MCQKVEKMGVSFISVHGRTKDQRCQPVDLEAVRTIKESVVVPVVANGDIRSLDDANRVHFNTGVDGNDFLWVFFLMKLILYIFVVLP